MTICRSPDLVSRLIFLSVLSVTIPTKPAVRALGVADNSRSLILVPMLSSSGVGVGVRVSFKDGVGGGVGVAIALAGERRPIKNQ